MKTSLLSACRETARRTFRIQSLRPEQESAMLAVLNGRDAFVSLPTGFGKSLIYQVPAMIVERPKIESTVRYLSVEIDDALDIAEKIEA